MVDHGIEKSARVDSRREQRIKDASEKVHSDPAVACIYRLDEHGETDCHPDDIVENLV